MDRPTAPFLPFLLLLFGGGGGGRDGDNADRAGTAVGLQSAPLGRVWHCGAGVRRQAARLFVAQGREGGGSVPLQQTSPGPLSLLISLPLMGALRNYTHRPPLVLPVRGSFCLSYGEMLVDRVEAEKCLSPVWRKRTNVELGLGSRKGRTSMEGE